MSRCKLFVMAGRKVAVSKGSTSYHFMCIAMGRVLVAASYDAGAVPGGCFKPTVFIGGEVANIYLDFGFSFSCRSKCKFLLMAGREPAATKENTSNGFFGIAMGHVFVAKTYAADVAAGWRGLGRQCFSFAAAGECFNLVVVFGLEVASTHLGFGSGFVCSAVSGSCYNLAVAGGM